jgi:galactose-1-phosphate uridylyltransferase
MNKGQRIGVRIDHLHHQLIPRWLEVVPFVDHHGPELSGGDAA